MGIFTVIFGMFFLAYPIYCIGITKRIHVLIAEAFSALFMLFIIITAILYEFNGYTLLRTEIITVLIAVVLFILAVVFCRKRPEFTIEKFSLKNLFFAMAFFLSAILSVSNFEAYGMGQDEGVYQIEAINILYGKSDWMQTLNEWSDERADQEYYNKSVMYLLGFDSYLKDKEFLDEVNNYEFIDVKAKTDDWVLTGYFHGIPTYPSYLALSAQIFGIKHMAWGNVPIVVCTLIFMNEVLKYFAVNHKLRYFLILLVGLCPQISWVCMSTLVEPLIMLILISFIYYLFACENEKKQFIAVVSLAVFSVLHVTVYTMMPLFILILWSMYFARDKIRYMVFSIVSLIVYWLGFLFMANMNPRYTFLNYTFFTKYFDGIALPTIAILIIVIAGIALSVLIVVIRNFIKNKKTHNENKSIVNEKIAKTVIFICTSILAIINIYVIICRSKSMDEGTFTIVSYIILTGLVVIPGIIALLALSNYKVNISSALIIASFLWCVFLYSAFMRPVTEDYYYYSRYLAPFIPIVALTFGILFSEYEKYGIILLTIAILFFLPFQYFIHSNKDDSRMDWDVITDIMELAGENFDENTDVYMDDELFYYLYFPIRACSDANIYFINMQYVKQTIEYEPERRVFYVTKEDYPRMPECVYQKDYLKTEDTGEHRASVIKLPTYFDSTERNIMVINFNQVYSDEREYSVDDAELQINGIKYSDEGKIYVNVRGILSEADEICVNDGKTAISYHVMSLDGDRICYENMRCGIGGIVKNEAEVCIDLNDCDFGESSDVRECLIQIDMVQDGVKWKSKDTNDLPVILMKKNDSGWRVKHIIIN